MKNDERITLFAITMKATALGGEGGGLSVATVLVQNAAKGIIYNLLLLWTLYEFSRGKVL